MNNLHESMGPGRDRTRDPWICSQTRICSHTRYRLTDLPLYINNVSDYLNAYDTTLYDIQNSIEMIEQNLQISLNQLHIWCKKQWNGVEFGKNKTNVDNYLSEATDNLNFNYNEELLKMISNDKILGVLC